MSAGQNIQQSILQAIDTIAQRRIDQLKLDKTITAIINSSVGVHNGKKIYKVEYEGGYFNATAQNKDDAYLPRMAVYVQVPEGDFSKEKFILGQASKLATDAQISVVSAAANNFSVIGKNAITNSKQEMGVHSYHDPNEESYNAQTKTINKIDHRYNFLYQNTAINNKLVVSDSDLNLYKNEATAIMIRADFMTKLTEEQQLKVTGEYGLVFNLVFKNLAAGFGETQGEVFDYFSNQITDGSKTLKSLNIKLTGWLNDSTSVTELTQADGNFDALIDEIQGVEQVFKTNHKEKYTATVQDLIAKYIVKIQDLKGCGNKTDMKNQYNNWRSTIIDQAAEKTVSYYLSSNDMVGNPFSFSSWISQYAVFEVDLDNFLRVDSILLYKEGFIESQILESSWQDGNPDILVRNIQLYMMKPLSENTAGYQLKVEAVDTGMIFETGNETDPLIAKSTVLRQVYEDLTNNQDTKIYWFKQNSSIVSPQQNQYNIYGGIGWARIDDNNPQQLKIYAKDNLAYENHYRCAAVYTGEETPIILRYDFIIYNYGGQKFVLQSDIGTNFSFDGGTPTITLFKQDLSTGELKELSNQTLNQELYNFKWAIIDNNNQKTFLDQEASLDLTNMTLNNYTSYSGVSKLLQDITWYNGDIPITTNAGREFATRIKYPMSNIPTASQITFECYINYRSDVSKSFSSIGKVTLTLSNFKVLSASSYRVYIEGGDQVFQYDEYGNAPNSDKHRDQIEVLPLKMHLFAPNNIEVQESSYRVKWFFPTKTTLIDYKNAKKDPVTGYFNMYEGNEVGFDIKSLYDYNAIDNQVQCQITFNDQTIYSRTDFVFTKVGNNGTNGTDMVAKIVPKTTNEIYNTQPFTLYISSDKKIYLNGSNEPSTNTKELTNGKANSGVLIAKLYQKNQEVTINNVSWNVAGSLTSGSNKNGHHLEVSSNGGLIWNCGVIKNYHQYIMKAQITYESKTYYAFYNLPVITYNGSVPTTNTQRIAIADTGYIKEVLYNSDGRNPLYNQNQGLELINVPRGATIKWTAKGGYVSEENSPNFKLLLDKDKRNEARTTFTNSQTKIYILPDDAYNGNITNNYIQAEVRNSNGTLIATVRAPVHMTLNTYGLASLNSWDGNSINIDEDNGFIMAPQIGAGYKDDSTNHFTGVVMGQADDYSSGNKHQYTGLMGFSQGLQSFFLDAETGNATFGVPTWENNDTSGQKIRYWNGTQWTTTDNYNEGRIELNPGGVSNIGGWRLGRRSLYYIEGNAAIGSKYNVDYIPSKASRTIIRGNDYNAKHERDIPHDKAGVLLHSGTYPYLSIKGKKLTSSDIDTSEKSYLRAGDSVEIQLDPQTPSVFSVFRHNGTPVYKSNGAVLYESGSRTFLSGIDARGEFIANALQAIVTPKGTAGSDVIANFATNLIPAFGETNVNATHIGLIAEVGNTTVAKIFKKNTTATNDTLYISGGTSSNNEYERPLSLHGKNISLYATSVASNTTSTNYYIKLSDTEVRNQIGNSYFILSNNNASSLSTRGSMTMLIGNSSRQNFTLYSANQSYTVSQNYNLSVGGNIETITDNGYISLIAKGSGKSFNMQSTNASVNINSGTTTDITAGSKITLTTMSASDIELRRNNSDNNRIYLGGSQILNKVDNNNYLNLNSNETSKLYSYNGLELSATNNQLKLIGNIDNMGGGNSDTTSDIVLKAGDTTSVRFKSYFAGGGSYPMDMDFGNAGYLDVYFPNDANQGWTTSAYSRFKVGMNLETPYGVEIDGNLYGADFGLSVNEGVEFKSWLHIIGNNAGQNENNALKVDGESYLIGQVNTGEDIHVGGHIHIYGNDYGNSLITDADIYTNGNIDATVQIHGNNLLSNTEIRTYQDAGAYKFAESVIQASNPRYGFTAQGEDLWALIADCLDAAEDARERAEEAINATNDLSDEVNSLNDEVNNKVDKGQYDLQGGYAIMYNKDDSWPPDQWYVDLR